MRFNNFLIVIYFISLILAHILQAQYSHQDYVNAHNAIRAHVGVGPITWNYSVAAYTQNYADQRRGDCDLDHSMGPYGENLAEGYGNLNGVDAVKMWVSEKPNYDYASNSCVGHECLHYTQGCLAKIDSTWVWEGEVPEWMVVCHLQLLSSGEY
ncbi:basic form of pathogenesis-related protein 1-like [Pistacia vera]|uniref:basic form of pathogenesis-related protein 1-like n=1 Tax=Pistacia vera TaxID=55513 RepID=UPI001262E907|nr:basic form of pathogenesis-related protein 1-like [Pistacia vera]